MQYMEFLRQVVEEGDSGICFLDPQGRVLYWNPAAERITGWKAGDVAGKLILSVYTPESRVEEHENFQRLAAGGDISFRFERDILKPDGATIKRVVPVQDLNAALTFAHEDIRDRWFDYLERYRRWYHDGRQDV